MTYCVEYAPQKPRWFYVEAAREYEKRLARYCKACRIEKIDHIGEKDFLIVITPGGNRVSSEDAADAFSALESAGRVNRVVFSFRQDMPVRADAVWKLTSIGVKEDLLLVLLLEQIYRAHKIMRNETYHK